MNQKQLEDAAHAYADRKLRGIPDEYSRAVKFLRGLMIGAFFNGYVLREQEQNEQAVTRDGERAGGSGDGSGSG